MDERFQNKYRISSARAQWHNYDNGMYFVTVCAKEKIHYFGEITDGKMNLTNIGRYTDEQFRNIDNHYPFAEIPLWVVMPNHVHAVVIIRQDEGCCGKGTVLGKDEILEGCRDAKFWECGDVNMGECRDAINRVSTGGVTGMHNPMNHKCLGTVIRGLKARITRFANSNQISFAWQPLFHDRIIRSVKEMNHVADYIENNVAKWQFDQFYG